jgi:hypothetical protein
MQASRISRKPEVATTYLRVTRDLSTGAAIGTVLRGTFAGSRFDELAQDELILLLKEARIDDPEGAALIEEYLDHACADWRADLARATGDADMTADEAREILGVAVDADEVTIIDAYRRLMRRMQSGEVGSDYFADKINRARDVLLKH